MKEVILMKLLYRVKFYVEDLRTKHRIKRRIKQIKALKRAEKKS